MKRCACGEIGYINFGTTVVVACLECYDAARNVIRVYDDSSQKRDLESIIHIGMNRPDVPVPQKRAKVVEEYPPLFDCACGEKNVKGYGCPQCKRGNPAFPKCDGCGVCLGDATIANRCPACEYDLNKL